MTRFVPAFSQVRLPGADAATPTVRMLLTMSAGFPTDDPWADRQEAMTADELDALQEYEGIGPVVSHSGGYPGFSAHMRWLPETGLGVVGFENATFSRVALPTTQAFDALIAGQASDAAARVWPETRAAQAAVSALVRSWSSDAAARLFTENVDQDMPLGHRRAAVEKAVDEVGGLTGESAVDVESAAPSHLVWLLPGRSGRLRVEVKLTPESPPRVQLLSVVVDRESEPQI